MTKEALTQQFIGAEIEGKTITIGFYVYGKPYYKETSNLEALKRLQMDKYPIRRYKEKYVTKKSALRALYNEVKKEYYG